MGIPRPPRGYWARVEAGEKLRREPLPQATPETALSAVFCVTENVARREEWALNNVLAAARGSNGSAVVLPPEGSELHAIAARHRLALEKVKPDELGLVGVSRKDLFPCAMSVAMVPRAAQALHAMVCELEDRDYGFKAGASEYQGLQITRDNDQVSLKWSEAWIEIEKEPTLEDKRRPSWTWQLRERRPSGKLSVEICASGLRGKRKWTEGEGRSLEEVLAFVVEKVEAVFHGYEEHRKRATELAKQREEEAKREDERRAKEELVRKERERIQRHQARLEKIGGLRRDNLDQAAREWIEAQGVSMFIDACEQRWRRANGGELSRAHSDWLTWARAEAEKMEPFKMGYPDPALDGGFEPGAVPVGGPYPEIRELKPDEVSGTPTADVRPQSFSASIPPEQFPHWLMHRRR